MQIEFFSVNTIASLSSCIMGNGVSPAHPPCLLFSCCNDVVCFNAQRGQCTSLQLSLAPRTVLAVQSWGIFSDLYMLLFSPGETSLSNVSILCRRLNLFHWGFNQSDPPNYTKETEIRRLAGIQQGHDHNNPLASSNGYNFITLLKEFAGDREGWIYLSCNFYLYRVAWGGPWWKWSSLCS